MAQGTICGRNYDVVQPNILSRITYQRRSRPRVIVEGIKHPGGVLPIRFKSVDRAERHIKNFKLELA